MTRPPSPQRETNSLVHRRKEILEAAPAKPVEKVPFLRASSGQTQLCTGPAVWYPSYFQRGEAAGP